MLNDSIWKNAQNPKFVMKIGQANDLKTKGMSWIKVKQNMKLNFKEWIMIIKVVEQARKNQSYKIK